MSLHRTFLEKLLVDAGYDLLEEKDGWIIAKSSYYHTHAALLVDEMPVLALPQKVAMQLNMFENGNFILLEDAPSGFSMGMALDTQNILRWLKKSVCLPEEDPVGVTTTDVATLVNQRRGQDKLRAKLIEYWEGRCAVTDVSTKSFLVASHIKPWSLCETSDEKLDVYNALLLNVALDRAFDHGFISFNDDGKIILSPQWSWKEANLFGINENMKLRKIEEQHRKYLRFHRDKIFQK